LPDRLPGFDEIRAVPHRVRAEKAGRNVAMNGCMYVNVRRMNVKG